MSGIFLKRVFNVSRDYFSCINVMEFVLQFSYQVYNWIEFSIIYLLLIGLLADKYRIN